MDEKHLYNPLEGIVNLAVWVGCVISPFVEMTARNLKPWTWNLEHETRNMKPETWNLEHETLKLEIALGIVVVILF